MGECCLFPGLAPPSPQPAVELGHLGLPYAKCGWRVPRGRIFGWPILSNTTQLLCLFAAQIAFKAISWPTIA